MSAIWMAGIVPGRGVVYPLPTVRGRAYNTEGGYMSLSRYATDAIGAFSLTLSGLVVSSAVQVEIASTGAVLSNTTAGASATTWTLPVYAAGSAFNNLRIKVRKGTASPFYLPWETLATAFVGSASIFVAQISDE